MKPALVKLVSSLILTLLSGCAGDPRAAAPPGESGGSLGPPGLLSPVVRGTAVRPTLYHGGGG